MALLKKGDWIKRTGCTNGDKAAVYGVDHGGVYVTWFFERFDTNLSHKIPYEEVMREFELVQPSGRVRGLIDRVKVLERQLAQGSK